MCGCTCVICNFSPAFLLYQLLFFLFYVLVDAFLQKFLERKEEISVFGIKRHADMWKRWIDWTRTLLVQLTMDFNSSQFDRGGILLRILELMGKRDGEIPHKFRFLRNLFLFSSHPPYIGWSLESSFCLNDSLSSIPTPYILLSVLQPTCASKKIKIKISVTFIIVRCIIAH